MVFFLEERTVPSAALFRAVFFYLGLCCWCVCGFFFGGGGGGAS